MLILFTNGSYLCDQQAMRLSNITWYTDSTRCTHEKKYHNIMSLSFERTAVHTLCIYANTTQCSTSQTQTKNGQNKQTENEMNGREINERKNEEIRHQKLNKNQMFVGYAQAIVAKTINESMAIGSVVSYSRAQHTNDSVSSFFDAVTVRREFEF